MEIWCIKAEVVSSENNLGFKGYNYIINLIQLEFNPIPLGFNPITRV